MKIEIFNTLTLAKESDRLDEKQKEIVWQERVVTPFEEMLREITTDFNSWGACDLNDLRDRPTPLEILERNNIVARVQAALEKAKDALQGKGNFPLPDTLRVALFMANGKHLFHEKLNHGFSGFGGFRGSLFWSYHPRIMSCIEAIVAHEFHHNVRNAIEPWPKDGTSVGHYLVIEGLAEAFAAEL